MGIVTAFQKFQTCIYSVDTNTLLYMNINNEV